MLTVCLAPKSSRAADSYHIDAGLGTVAPLYVGGQVLAELPARIIVSAEAGVIPKPYASFINSVAQAFDAYNDETAEIIKGAVTGGFVFRPSVGFRPARNLNLEILAGYTLFKLSEDLSGVDRIKQATRRSSEVTGDEQVDLASTIHAFHVTVGYAWLLTDHLVLRATLGYTQAVASSTSIRAPAIEAREPAAFRVLADQLDSYLNEKYTTYVKLPTLGLTVNYRF